MSINIKFPFKDSVKGFFLDVSEDTESAIKNDLIHLLLTAKRERYYLPEFGCNLRRFIFEPNDSVTESEIKEELNLVIKSYIPNLTITKLFVGNEDGDHSVTVRVDYLYTEGVFETKDFVVLKF